MNHAAKRPQAHQQRGSGGHGRDPEPRFLVVGYVIGVHGVRGELKVEILTEDPHRFSKMRSVFVGLGHEEPVPWPLQGYRLHKGRALLKLLGCDDRTSAQAFYGHLIQVPVSEAIPLEEGEYFEHQILGLAVWTKGGEYLGELSEILYTGANDVYVVQGVMPGRREILIPALEDVILEVDLQAGRLVVELPEGLM